MCARRRRVGPKGVWGARTARDLLIYCAHGARSWARLFRGIPRVWFGIRARAGAVNTRGRSEGDRFAIGADSDHRDSGAGDSDGGAGEIALDFNIDENGDTGRAETFGACIEVDDVAKLDGGDEIDAIHGGGDPAVDAMAAGLDEAGLIDIAEDDAAEDRAVLIGVAGHGDDAEGEAAVVMWGGLFRGGHAVMVAGAEGARRA